MNKYWEFLSRKVIIQFDCNFFIRKYIYLTVIKNVYVKINSHEVSLLFFLRRPFLSDAVFGIHDISEITTQPIYFIFGDNVL